jgi:2,4-dienoyl-CoA reductase-like NADH-dependent reductase (Old Yellow Enzyme family)
MHPPHFPLLFSPYQLGSITLPNRLMMAPHGVVFSGGYGGGTDRIVDYHIERAKGGVGLIVMSNFLMPASWREMASWGGNLTTTPLGNLDLANDEAMMPAYRRLIDGVHEHGSKFISQLNASGRQLHPPGATSFGIPLFAPSALPCT